jgi:hypothetical protein
LFPGHLAEKYLANKMIWSTQCFGQQNDLIDPMFWPTKWFDRPNVLADKMIWSTQCFGRQNDLIDPMFWPTKLFDRPKVLADKMIWLTQCFGWQNDLIDPMFWPTKCYTQPDPIIWVTVDGRKCISYIVWVDQMCRPNASRRNGIRPKDQELFNLTFSFDLGLEERIFGASNGANPIKILPGNTS